MCRPCSRSTPTCRGATSEACRPTYAGSLTALQSELPRGSTFAIRGQVQSMNTSYRGLGFGLLFAVLLVYFLMVVELPVVA